MPFGPEFQIDVLDPMPLGYDYLTSAKNVHAMSTRRLPDLIDGLRRFCLLNSYDFFCDARGDVGIP